YVICCEHQHQGVAVAPGCEHGGNRDRRPGIAAHRLEHDVRLDGALAQLLRHHEAKIGVCITIGRANSSGSDMRPSTCWNVDACPTKGTNCLGMLSRETGHSRVPTPPHMITEIICTGMALACSNTSSHSSAERQAASQRIFFRF